MRFDDYSDCKPVTCNNCEHYWTSACDGVEVGEHKKCTSYKATRYINIIKKIDDVENELNKRFLFNSILTALLGLLVGISTVIRSV